MERLDEFKSFVKDNPKLINYVKNNEMSWQKFYELYSLYGNDHNVWDNYLKKEENKTVLEKNTSKKPWDDIVNIAKNVDVDKVQNGISSLQKAIGLLGEIFVSKDTSSKTDTYTPRSLYRKFED